MRTTYMAKESDIERKWHVVDATGIPLGRLSAAVAKILRGKHKPTYTPHVDTGDYVIILNASNVKLTGNKASDKIYSRHTGYPGGLKQISAGELRERKPERLVELSIKGMLPNGPLGRKQAKKLFVYADGEHKHQAQQPQELDIKNLI
ncbi:50S ribosomal protein L13 [Dolosigranulum savutiense]|uniref:Large ribosomal subunit protein uL13 n=1 Tax=Dolosigranulum savutiense TaxID=3110288 RepID=A0AB74UAR7_9LACT